MDSIKYILKYITWGDNEEPYDSIQEKEFDVDLYKSEEQVARFIKGLISLENGKVPNVFLQLYSGNIPDSGNLLDRALWLCWNPRDELIILHLPFNSVVMQKYSDEEKYNQLLQDFRKRGGQFEAQVNKNPYWLAYLNVGAFANPEI